MNIETSSVQRINETIILTIYTDQEEKMTYTITPDKIIFTMFDNAILYTKNNSVWQIESISSKDLNFEHSILSLVGNIKMIVFYNLDITYRWFEKTKETAIALTNINDTSFLDCDLSELRGISMTPKFPSSEYLVSPIPSRAVSCSLSDGRSSPCPYSNQIITKSIIYRKPSPQT